VWAVGAGTLALLAVAGQASDFQFRINQANAPLGFALTPPTVGLVYGGNGQNGNVMDAMAFAWNQDFPTPVAIPFCGRRCGTDPFLPTADDAFGGGALVALRVDLRRFNPLGAAIDALDQQIATSVLGVNGPAEEPALALRPVNTGPMRANPFVLTWWDMWSWNNAGGPCGAPACDNQPVGWWLRGWNNFSDALPAFGSALLSQPERCRAQSPSPAWGPQTLVVAYRDVTEACREIKARISGPLVPGGTATITVRAPGAGFDVARPCAAWASNDSFVVAWREDELTSGNSAIMMRRVFNNGTLGAVVEVASFGTVSPNCGPAVSCFDDGSIVVQWVTFNNGDPPTHDLQARGYDHMEPPNSLDLNWNVEALTSDDVNHTITARGATISDVVVDANRAVSVYEYSVGDSVGNVYGRRLRLNTGSPGGLLGPRTLIPLNTPEESGNSLGAPHQHTALLRSDGRVVVGWRRGADGNNYATARTLPLVTPCGQADIAGPGPSVGFDGELTADDIILFINWFTSGDSRADVAGPGPSVGSDGEFTADDIILFINWFTFGC
jgi:hypothetical protein